MVFFAWRALRPRARTRDVGLLAAATSAVAECAKLWQAPWLAAFRHTAFGHLLYRAMCSHGRTSWPTASA